MSQQYILLFVFIVCFCLLLLVKKLLKLPSDKLPYEKKQYILSQAEHSFFEVLQGILGNNFYIFPQVNLDKFIYIHKGTGKYQSYYHRINQYSVDFLICDRTKISPLLAIELDDSSHTLTNRVERDNFINQVFTDANIPLLRESFRQSYNLQELGLRIQDKLNNRA